MDKIKKRWAGYFVGLLVVLAAAAWWLLRPPGLPAGFASSNGRIEATEVDIASKIAGRIDTILVKEGQFVRQGEVLARMDTRVLNEQRLEAAAQIKEAESAVLAARALLDQRQSEMRASEAVVKQRQAELDSSAKRHVRSNALSQRGAVSAQQLGRVVVRYKVAPVAAARATESFDLPSIAIDLCPYTTDRIVPGSLRFT